MPGSKNRDERVGKDLQQLKHNHNIKIYPEEGNGSCGTGVATWRVDMKDSL